VDEQRLAFAGVMAIESRSRQRSRQPGRIVDGDGGQTWISEAQRLLRALPASAVRSRQTERQAGTSQADGRPGQTQASRFSGKAPPQ
jgi:hypothetical protein